MKNKMKRWAAAILCCLTLAVILNFSPVTVKAADSANQTTTTVKKAGNFDKYIGLSSDYWVMATAKTKNVHVYSRNSTSSTDLGHFSQNNCVRVKTDKMVKGGNYAWLQVYLQNGKVGYVEMKRVTLGTLNIKNFGLTANTAENKKRIAVCRFGLPYIGTKFVLGGSSLTKGIDCSTFARTAMRRNGVMVSSSATAYRLSNTGKAITRSQLKPGDMVFYPESSSNSRISHCAIYIGDGYIINASGHQGHYYPSGGIRISKIDYRYPTAKKFRNIIG